MTAATVMVMLDCSQQVLLLLLESMLVGSSSKC